MDVLQRFMAYAGDFERTLRDDDWTRLRQYFAADAVYEVQGASLDCRLVGPDAIFAGIKKSLDGFDRRFEGRDLALTSDPDVSGNELSMGWKVVYRKAELPPFTLHGRSRARYAGDRIVHLVDSYDAAMADAFAAWQRETGLRLDGSYV